MKNNKWKNVKNMKNMKNWFLFFALASLLLGMGLGCGSKKDAQDEQNEQTFFQETGRKADRGVEKAKDKIDEVLDQTGKKIEQAGEKLQK